MRRNVDGTIDNYQWFEQLLATFYSHSIKLHQRRDGVTPKTLPGVI